MNQRRFWGIVILFLVAMIVCALGYFIFLERRPLMPTDIAPLVENQPSDAPRSEERTLLFGQVSQTQISVQTFLTDSEYKNYIEQTNETPNGESFVFEYPSGFTFHDSQSTPGSWVITKLQEGRVIKPIGCGGFLKEPDEISFSWSIFDRQNPEYSGINVVNAIENRYNAPNYVPTSIGDKSLKVRRLIPGMCGNGDEFIWMEPSGRYIVLFSIDPSNTKLIAEYESMIESFEFLN